MGHENTAEGGTTVGGLPAKRQKVADPDLPSTCTLLISPNTGTKVYLIGTAHFSKESCEDVATVIQAVQPDVVMVELCKSRTNILHLDEATILEEAKNLDMEKSLEILKSHGTVQGVMYLLLLSMSAHLTKELGMAPGGEFRRAFVEAMKVPGCKVHLGGGNVVAVVGIGHVPGMVENWGKVTTEQVKEVVKLDPPSLLGRIIRLTVKTAFYGGCLYGAYRITRGPVSRLLLVR